jgi:uncharacterized membrane protein YhaH (DUF805 family)
MRGNNALPSVVDSWFKAAESFGNKPRTSIESQAMQNPYASPRGEIVNPASTFTPLTWKQILFSFQGRIPRRQYWGATGIMILIFLVPAILAGFLLPVFSARGRANPSPASEEIGTLGIVLMVLLIPVVIFAVWAGLAIAVKRWHDRGKSGWWILIGFIPYLGALWQFIECGCLRGTEGENRFGGDPT